MPRAKTQRRISGRPPKHGARLMQRILDEQGIDGRTKLARIVRDGENAMAEQFGGWANVSYTRERTIRHLNKLDLITNVEADWVVKRIAEAGVLDDNDEPLSLLLRSYATHLGALLRGLSQLETDVSRDDRPPFSLADYVEQKRTETAQPATDNDAEDSRQESD